MQWENSLFNRIQYIQSQSMLHDFGGGSPLNKCYIMAYLAVYFKLINYVEIGVYKGRSLFSVAPAFKDNKGKAYGIDPYKLEEAKEFDLEEGFRDQVNSFLEGLDFEDIYKDVLINRKRFGLSDTVELIRETSEQAVSYFKNIKIDMLHIDGNHDTKCVESDINNYAPFVKDGGIIIFDDIDWDSVKCCYDEIKNDYIVLLETDNFAIMMKSEKSQKNLDMAGRLTKKLKNLYLRLLEVESGVGKKRPTFTVGVLAYNHGEYIVECLDSIFKQKGNFDLKVIICEDKSTDNTAVIIEDYISNAVIGEHISIEYLKSEENLGMVKNLKRLIKACEGSDYTAIIDGDDYWNNESKLQIHVDFMESHPECALSFDSITFYYEDEDKFKPFDMQQRLKGNIFTTTDIIKEYFIGNISCCVYYGKILDQIPDEFFEMFVGDWALNIMCSQYGDIGYIKKQMTVYRKHPNGIWSGIDSYEKNKKTLGYVDDYNKFFNYTYDREFSETRDSIAYKLDDRYLENYDLVIIDDIFPHPVSGFRYQEFLSYLQQISSIKILTTGWSVHVFGEKTVYDLIIDFKRKFPHFGSKLQKFSLLDNISCKLLYFVFLGYANYSVELAEQFRVPFVFTLYPGGTFALNNPSSDEKLKRVVESPCFRKVIVTQKVTYDYLINKKFCEPEQIEYIFGVVTPLEKVEKEYVDKMHFGIDKSSLDICFVAHKYTEYGQDKGYDIFIEVAKALARKYDNINFHVVGNFDEKIIDVSDIKDRITFYGIQPPDWFDGFYKDKDVILSPNTPGVIYEGSFDGFPTASCTDAGLCKTAIFCTDPLGLNDNHFTDGKELVIVEHDVINIVEKIEYYYSNTVELKDICENGYLVIKELYGFDKQIAPRLQLLKEEIAKPFIYDEKDFADLYRLSLRERIYNRLKKACPQQIKKCIKSILKR